MDGGILPDLAVFVLNVFVLKLTGICVTMYLYLWVKIVALTRGLWFCRGRSLAVMETLNSRQTGDSSNLKIEMGESGEKGIYLFLFVLPRSTTLVQGQSFTLTCVVAASASANE